MTAAMKAAKATLPTATIKAMMLAERIAAKAAGITAASAATAE